MLRLQKLLGKVQGNLSQALAATGRPFLVRKVLRDTKWPISRASVACAGDWPVQNWLGGDDIENKHSQAAIVERVSAASGSFGDFVTCGLASAKSSKVNRGLPAVLRAKI